jgi:hypothetical protein
MEVKTEGVNGNSVEEGAMNSEVTQGMRDNIEGPVLSDLLRDVPRLVSEESKDILRFFCGCQRYI